ncbi:MAG: hypothetical protein AAFO74_12950 [Pseudomonadota bacterium]
MKWSKYPQEMQDYICQQRQRGLSGKQVHARCRIMFPKYPISLGGVYHVERKRKGQVYREPKPKLAKPMITLCGPAWSIEDIPNTRIAA